VSALRNSIVLHLQADSSVTTLATGGVHHQLPAEDDQSFPFVVVEQFKPTGAEWTFQGISHEDALYLVKAIDKNTTPARVEAINTAIRASLNLATLAIEGYESMGVMLMRTVEYPDLEEGGHYQYEGGIYSLMARET
jgi:hypothetical protein